MAERTAIEWCDSTFNPWVGCQAVSPDGCKHCYAEQWAKRAGRDFAARTRTKTWGDPVKWNAAHEAFFAQHGRRQRVFCASLADVFDNAVPHLWRQHLISLVADTPNLDWLFLTKRIGNAARMLSDASMHDGRLLTADDQYRPPENLWIGATVVNQAEADRDIPKLLATPAAVRFLSVEPMLGPISFEGMFAEPGRANDGTNALEALDWVICGGESGTKARPMHPDWARSLRDQCAAASVPILFKQWGEWAEEDTGLPEPLVAREGDPEFHSEMARHEGFLSLAGHFVTDPGEMTDGVRYRGLMRPGKQAAGRLLDGIEHNGFPAPPGKSRRSS